MILIHGAPRSGTTWLAKIFDSHPDVLYRHEPDIELRNTDIPFLPREDEIEASASAAREYVATMHRIRTLRTSGTLPVFPKAHNSRLSWLTRYFIVAALHALDQFPAKPRWVGKIDVPDLISRRNEDSVVPVIKSVGSLARIRLYLHAVPESKVVFIIRHPCGYVSSVMRGRKTGSMGSNVAISGLAETGPGRRRGLTNEYLAKTVPVERLAWVWTLLNELALENSDNSERFKLVRYEDLCESPIKLSKELFAFCNLDWKNQSEKFLQRSTNGPRDARYFSVIRDPLDAAMRWQKEMTAGDIETVEKIAKNSLPGNLFYNNSL
ncbi:MAG: sulfotransferase [Alphaproteobacteria bacterium]